MWIVGIVFLLFVACLLIFFIARFSPPVAKRPIWDIPRVAGTLTSIVGTLAGFSIASSFFLANLIRSTDAPELETAIGMLIIAFLVLVGTAMTYGITPNVPGGHASLTHDQADEQFVTVQKLVFVLANSSYYIGIALAWLSLRPLTIAVGLQTFAAILAWLLLFVVFAGAARLSMYYYILAGGSRFTTASIPVIGLGLASLYRLVLVPILPTLWPTLAPSLAFAVVAFVLSATVFVAGSLLVQTLATPIATPSLQSRGERFLLFFIQAVVCAIALLWYSVALP